jgi:hypothetical protein
LSVHFSHARLATIGFFDQINSFLISNLWRFQLDNLTETKTIDSLVYVCDVDGYGYSLDTSLMHPLVFYMVLEINIFHSIGAIQNDLFKHFVILDAIYFYLDSFKNFFHRIGVNWTAYLLNDTLVEFSSIFRSANGWINGPDYLYPDEDFCLFADQWPLYKAITPVFDKINLTECTSTLIYIMSPYFAYSMSLFLESYPSTHEIFTICLNSTIAVEISQNLSTKLLTSQRFSGRFFRFG